MTSTPLHLVVIGAAARGPDPKYKEVTASIPIVVSHLPTVDNVAQGITMAIECGFNLKIYFIDPIFEYRTLPEDAQKIAAYPSGVVTITSTPPEEFEFAPPLSQPVTTLTVETDVVKAVSTDTTSTPVVPVIPATIRNTSEPVIVVSYGNETSTFEIMSTFGSFNTINRFFVVANSKSIPLSVDTIVAEVANRINNTPIIEDKSFVYISPICYNIVSGSQVPENVAGYDLIAIKANIALLAEITAEYNKAGWLQEQFIINSIAKSWYMNVETLILAAFFDRYQPQMQALDKDIQLTILTNNQFRKNITIYLIGILSNFAVANGLLTPNEIVQLGGYTRPEFYEAIKTKLADFTVTTSHSVLS
jgi:hypothetical protein